jgi:Zn-finger nucleic acid-binding protein
MSSLLITCPKCGYKTLTTHGECIHCSAPLGDLAKPMPWAEPAEQAPPEAPAEPPAHAPAPPEPERHPAESASPGAGAPPARRRLPPPPKRKETDTVWPPKSSHVPARPPVNRSEERARDLDPKAPRASAHRRGQCPRGHGALAQTTLHDKPVAVCRACKGLWIDHATFNEFLRQQAQHVLEMKEPAPTPPQRPLSTPGINRPAICPACCGPMERRIFGDFSGILVDICRRDGVWLDDLELQAIMRYIATAGPEFAKKLIG